MARYSAEHKARSRAAIRTAAAKRFRTQGFAGTRIDDLCSDADLTRGTFYAHFESKQALFNDVISGPHDLIERLRSRTPNALKKGATRTFRDYLNPRNRSAVLSGCSLASLSAEVARANDSAQGAYADAVAQLVDEIRRDQPQVSREQALSTVAIAIGGLLVSGACGSSSIANELEHAATAVVTTLLNTTTTAVEHPHSKEAMEND